jgi:hypothetical protein
MAQEYKSWPVAVLVAIDQLGNAIARGNPDATISARVGYFSENAKRVKKYWKILESIIDFAFFPIDGRRHCYQAWQNDKDERFQRGSDLGRVILSAFIIIFCPIIAIVLRVVVIFYRPWKFSLA